MSIEKLKAILSLLESQGINYKGLTLQRVLREYKSIVGGIK